MSRIKPKIRWCECSTDSKMAYAFTGGIKELLELQAKGAIAKLLRSYGPNACGHFRIRVGFWPNGSCSDE